MPLEEFTCPECGATTTVASSLGDDAVVWCRSCRAAMDAYEMRHTAADREAAAETVRRGVEASGGANPKPGGSLPLAGPEMEKACYYCLVDGTTRQYVVRAVYRSDQGVWSRWNVGRRAFVRVDPEVGADLQRRVMLAGDIDLDLVSKQQAMIHARSLLTPGPTRSR